MKEYDHLVPRTLPLWIRSSILIPPLSAVAQHTNENFAAEISGQSLKHGFPLF